MFQHRHSVPHAVFSPSGKYFLSGLHPHLWRIPANLTSVRSSASVAVHYSIRSQSLYLCEHVVCAPIDVVPEANAEGRCDLRRRQQRIGTVAQRKQRRLRCARYLSLSLSLLL